MQTALRLLIELPLGDRRGDRELGRQLRDIMGEPWRVQHLFRNTRDRQLSQFRIATGTVPMSAQYGTLSLAYDLSHELGPRLDARIEPDLPSSAFGPEA